MSMADNQNTTEPRNGETFSQGQPSVRREHREPEARGHSHVRVVVNGYESIEKVIRRFKKACEKEGIKKEIKARRFYEKPSDARRRELRKKERNRLKSEKPVKRFPRPQTKEF